MLRLDVLTNQAIGMHRAEVILADKKQKSNNENYSGGVDVLTICNTGSLATVDTGQHLVWYGHL
jgi:methylthioribose-1-phosphate isomerase